MPNPPLSAASTRPPIGASSVDGPVPAAGAVMPAPAPLPPPLRAGVPPSPPDWSSGSSVLAAPVVPAAARAYGNPPRSDVPPFLFDGRPSTFLGIWLLSVVVTVATLGLGFPFAVVLKERWRARHTLIEGRRLVFTGSALGLFFRWLGWELLILVTLGVYSLWVVPRMTRWRVENLTFERT